MAAPETDTGIPSAVGSGLVCRLRQKAGRPPGAGEIELENTSPGTLEIEVQASPLQYLDLVVHSSGDVVSEGFYGNFFSPMAAPYVLRLLPGETYTGPVSLLGTVPTEKRLPGTYTVRAVYEYRTLQAVSEPIQVRYGGETPESVSRSNGSHSAER